MKMNRRELLKNAGLASGARLTTMASVVPQRIKKETPSSARTGPTDPTSFFFEKYFTRFSTRTSGSMVTLLLAVISGFRT